MDHVQKYKQRFISHLINHMLLKMSLNNYMILPKKYPK